MKLSKTLMSAGILNRGEVRHCSEWEFPLRAGASRFGMASPVQRVFNRRIQITGYRPGGIFSRLPAWLGRRKRK